MYTEFLKTLAEIAEKLDEAAKMGGNQSSMPVPYIAGVIDVKLDGEKVGEFLIEDDYVIYKALEETDE